MNIAGFSLSNWMTYGLSFTHGSVAWRFPIAFQLVFSAVLLSTVPWLPESPRWLLAHGYTEQGVNVLAALEGSHATPKDDIIVNQRDTILEAVRIERETAPTWRDVMKGNTGNTGMIQRLILGAGKEQSVKLFGPVITKDVIQELSGCNSWWALTLRATSKVYIFTFFLPG
jgi:Sugar (and other) transporter